MQAQDGIETIRADTRRRQAEAADPNVSAWVSANAGTGKTHVLTNRVLRLLLSGAAPERILALTYTKAAAAEMSTRVALDAMQVFGGYGYLNELPLGRLVRDAKLLEIGAGTSEIRRLIIGRELLK